MSIITQEQILSALSAVRDPLTNKNVVELNLISGVIIKNGNIGFSIEIEASKAEEMETVRIRCEEVVRNLPGVLSCTAVLTAERQATEQPKANTVTAEKTRQVKPPALVDSSIAKIFRYSLLTDFTYLVARQCVC